MIQAKVYSAAGVLVGERLPSYTRIGCYPMVYLNSKSCVLCADCVNSSELTDNVVDCGVHWEGENLYCDACESEIESAYGPIES